MPKVKLNSMHALVTGASSGIGRATALELARAGCTVSIAARRVERLEELAKQIEAAGQRAHVFPADLSVPGAARELAGRVEDEAGPVDLLMNNAGVSGEANFFTEKDAPTIRETIEVNFAAPAELAHALLPGMVKRRRGALVTVSSGFALLAVPESSLYCATKAGIAMLDEALRLETAGRGVHVLSVYPGPVDTEMLQGTMAQSKSGAQLERLPTGTAEECARKIRQYLEKGRPELFYPEVFAAMRPLLPLLSRTLRLASPYYNRLRFGGKR